MLVARDLGVVGYRYGDAYGPPVPLELATLATLGHVIAPARLRQVAEHAAERAREGQSVHRRHAEPHIELATSNGLAVANDTRCGAGLGTLADW